MRRVLYTTLVTFLVLLIGQTLYFNSKDKRDANFIEKEVYENLKNNEINEFIDSTFLVMGADSYYKDPLYKFNSDNINIDIYVANVGNKKVLVTFYYNVKNEESLKGLDIKFSTNASNIVLREERPLLDLESNYLGGGFFKPVYVDNNSFYYIENNNEIRFREITSIEMSYTYLGEDINNKLAVNIYSNESYNPSNNNIVNLEDKTGVLSTEDFNGKIEKYNKLELEDANLIKPNTNKFKPYNKTIYTTLGLYATVVILVGVYAMFRKQIHGLFIKDKLSDE